MSKLLDWSDSSRQVQVRANAETVEAVNTALSFGAEGIGLARSEHMFFSRERMVALRRLILSEDADDRAEALTGLVDFQTGDYSAIFTAMRGKPVTHLRIAYAGSRAEGEPLLAPMRAVAPALLDAVADMPYAHSGSIHRDPHLPIPFYHSGVLFREVNGDTVDALLGACGPDTNIPMILWELRQLGGGFARGPAAGNAVGGRDAAWGISIVGLNTPQTAAAVAEGLGRVVRALAPWSTGGTAINLHGMIGNEADRARAWDDATYQRLVTLVHRYDPKGLMRFGHVVGRNAGG